MKSDFVVFLLDSHRSIRYIITTTSDGFAIADRSWSAQLVEQRIENPADVSVSSNPPRAPLFSKIPTSTALLSQAFRVTVWVVCCGTTKGVQHFLWQKSGTYYF